MKIHEIITVAGAMALMIFGIYSFTAQPQQFNPNDSFNKERSREVERHITVTGSAEMKVQPDELELQISLHENSETQLDKAEEKFYKILKEYGISKDGVSFNQSNSNWYWYYWWSYRNNPVIRKQFYIKLKSNTNFLELVQSLNKKWVEHIQIYRSGNSKIQALREEVKIEAIKAAKKKAGYLLKSIDEKLGPVISIEEINSVDNNDPYWWNRNNFNSLSNSVVNYSSDKESDIENTHAIKLRYEIRTTFEIN